MHKIIFDKSILSGQKFENLKASYLKECVAGNKLKLFYTSRFIEETLQQLTPYDAKHSQRFIDEFNWLLELNQHRWFRSPSEIHSKGYIIPFERDFPYFKCELLAARSSPIQPNMRAHWMP